MRSIVFLIVLSGSAFASEPTVADASINAAKEARASAVTAYRAKLAKSREIVEGRLDTASDDCDRARGVYLEVSDPLAKVNGELEEIPLTDAAPELVSANETYRRELTKLKTGYEAQIKEAKKHAESAGATLRAAKADLDKIDAEVKRLNDEAAWEKRRAELAACDAQYVTSGFASHCDQQPYLGSAGRLYGHSSLGGDLMDWEAPLRRNRVWLPSEFGACFPGEVKKEEPKPEAPKAAVPPPPFPVELYPLPK